MFSPFLVFTVSIFVLLFTLFNSHNVAVSWKEELPDCLLDKDYKKLLYIVENGLPPTATSHHVVIGGAGMAGLTAAKLLHDAGHKVHTTGRYAVYGIVVKYFFWGGVHERLCINSLN